MILFSRLLNDKSKQLAKGKASTSQSVSEALDVFQAVRSNVWLLVLKYLTWITLCASIWIVLVDVVFGPDLRFWGMVRISNFSIGYTTLEMSSQLLAYALGFFAVRQLLQLVPITLLALWNRNIVAIKPKSGFNDDKLIEKEIESPTNPLKSAQLEEQYLIYIQEFEDRLNHPILQWISGSLFALLFASPFTGNPIGLLSFSIKALQYDWYLAENIAESIALLLICFTAGIMIWRMVITGWQIRRLGKMFNLTPQLGHPDGCGGLSPVGNLCLWIAMIISIIGAVLSAWIILWPYLGEGYRSTDYLTLLPIPVFLALVGFFLPLWNIHRVMVGKKMEIQKKLDQLGKSIDRLESEMLGKGDELEPDETEKITKRLELLRQTYQRNLQYRTWPYNTETLKKLLLSQTAPVVALLSQVLPQIGKTSVDAAKIIVDSTSQWWK
jgi:hypothetical protein